MNQVRHHRRQPITSILRPAILDRNVPAFNETNLSQPLSERANPDCIDRRATKKSDHRHRRLLRTRSDLPRGC
jgi:hypothetical protein